MPMKHKLIVFALLLTAAHRATAEWQVLAAKNEPSTAVGVLHRQVTLEDSATGENSTLELVLFPARSNTLRVIDNRDGSRDLDGAMRAMRCLAGVNGGFFDPNFAPIGLLVVDGKTIAPLQHARLLSGVLFASER